MPTTSNFGWTTPADTDLVKDGALAIRTLGNGIDTSMAELKGGTTGQILSKTSNTDMDFTWINNDQGDITGVTAGTGISGGGTSGTVTITNSMATEITAAGDIIVGTGSGTFDNLPIGTTGQVLTADTTVSPYKVKWATAAAGGGDLTLIGTYTMPGSATTYSLNSVFSSTYTNYLIVGQINNGATGNVHIKMRASGTDSSTSYNSLIAYWGVTQADGTTKSSASTSGFLLDNTGTGPNFVFIQLFNPFDAAITGFIQTGHQKLAGGYARYGSGYHDVATSYDGFTIVSGNNLSGTFSLYGFKK